MPRLGNITRPAEVFAVIHASAAMNAEAALLLSRAAYAWFDRPPSRDARVTLRRALASKVGALEDDVTVTDHFPEPFFVRFTFPHHRADAVALHDFDFEGYKVQVRPWRLEDNADHVGLQHHVRLCIESVPMYAWNAASAQQAIGSSCSLDYIEDTCVRREYTKALCVWAWVANPNLVPRVGWVTLPGPDAAPGVRERGRRGLQRRCIIHLDIVEDLTLEEAPMPCKGSWRWGVVDGEQFMRDRGERLEGAGSSRGRRDEDDDDRDRRGRNSSRGWGAAIRRSLSRSARAGDHGDRSDRQRDRSNHRDVGRRRAADEAAADALPRAVAGRPLLLLGNTCEGLAATPAAQVAAPTIVSDADSTDVDEEILMDGDGRDHEAVLRHGRATSRSATPGASRRRSRAAKSPQSLAASSSPTSVLPSSPASKGQRLSQLWLQDRHQVSVGTPVRPPGFDTPPGSPAFHTPPSSPTQTPVLAHVSPLARTPPRRRPGSSPGGLQLPSGLFAPALRPLLSPPTSSPPQRPANRRKTLAGVTIGRTIGFTLKQASARNKAGRKTAPVAKRAEAVLCRGLGIIKDGEVVTEQAMAEFAARFQGQVTQEVIDAMKVLFNIATEDEDEVDQALIQGGGAAALDLEDEVDGTADV